LSTRIEQEQRMSRFMPNYVRHPGVTLLETLETLGMSQAQLAERTGRPLKTINEIIQGKTAITADTALQLERATGVPAVFWNNAQANYAADVARLKEQDALAGQVEWARRFPLNAMVKLGWAERRPDPVSRVRELLDFFGVAGKESWESIWLKPQASFKQSPVFEANPYAVAAWLRQGELEARKTLCALYDEPAFLKALKEIRRLTTQPPEKFEPEAKRLCVKAGVALVFLPELPGTRAYGATRWLGPRKALIQLSLRGKTDDLLWFSFFHEAAHILRHGKRQIFIESDKRRADPPPEEAKADRFAADFLILPSEYAAFRERRDFGIASVRRFAAALNIAPGIVVGRLQHDRVLNYGGPHQRLKKHFAFAQ
jgi:addiction module HigA family antidote